ncbi:MAG: OadG family protein, partial [Lachnospiraceae bacterium]|nr:OadG family protein [Lachnospiraceae bacterium]
FCVLCLVLGMSGCGKETEKLSYDEDKVINNAQFAVMLYGTDGTGSKTIGDIFGVQDYVAAGQIKESDIMQDIFGVDDIKDVTSFDDEDIEIFSKKVDTFRQNGYGIPIFQGNAIKTGYESYRDATKELGKIVSISDEPEITATDSEITCKMELTGENKGADGKPLTAETEILFTKNLAVKSFTVNINRTFGEKMANAGLNTLLGMGMTFCVLILISVVIWLMGTIVQSVTQKKKALDETEPVGSGQADRSSVEASANEQAAVEETADDEALVAVIAAAIAAYESGQRGYNVSPDTFVVKSVKRRRSA